MPTLIGYHHVKDTKRWLASPMREKFFGPLAARGESRTETFRANSARMQGGTSVEYWTYLSEVTTPQTGRRRRNGDGRLLPRAARRHWHSDIRRPAESDSRRGADGGS